MVALYSGGFNTFVFLQALVDGVVDLSSSRCEEKWRVTSCKLPSNNGSVEVGGTRDIPLSKSMIFIDLQLGPTRDSTWNPGVVFSRDPELLSRVGYREKAS